MFGAAIAVWIDVRFPNLAPEDLRGAAIRLAIAFVAAQAAVPVTSYLAGPLSSGAEMASVLAVGFAALTFLFVSVVWIVRTLQRLVGGMLR